MLEGISALLELARVDTRIAELEAEKQGLPASRAALDQERSKAAEAVATAQAALAEAEQEQRRQEAVVNDQEALARRLEGQTAQVKTNAAYTALLHEIDQARAAISEGETRVLEAMEAIEAARSALERARAAARGVDERTGEQARSFDEREKSIDQSLGNLHRERDGIASGVDAALLARYTRIASRRRPAVAVIRRETCQGCRVSVPPQQLLELRKGDALIVCGSCQRILVLEDPRSAA